MIGLIGVHIVSGFIGFVLLKGSVMVWLAQMWPWYRRKVEHIFVRDQNLFAQDAPYSGTVTFFKWYAFVPGALIILPRFVIIDIIVVLTAIVLWRYLVGRARQAVVQA